MKIGITGATGYLGKMLIKKVMEVYKPEVLRLISRSEWKMAQILRENNELYKFNILRPLICDVRDRERVFSCLEGLDLVIHAAALKRLEIANYNPQECIKTNIVGSMNVMDACLNVGVKKAIFVSSDKAVNPLNLYGRTKSVMESMVIERARIHGENDPIMCCVRYGNVVGSTGAMIPYVIARVKQNLPIPLTHPEMTRFLITKKSAWAIIDLAIKHGGQGEVVLPQELKSINIGKAIGYIKDYFSSASEVDLIGMWPGEKLHEEISEGVTSKDHQISRKEFMEILNEEGLI